MKADRTKVDLCVAEFCQHTSEQLKFSSEADMVKQAYLEENFRLFSPKYLLVCLLLCLVIASKLDVFVLWGFLSVSLVQSITFS